MKTLENIEEIRAVKTRLAQIKADKFLKYAETNDKKAKTLRDGWNNSYGQFDWTEPIKLGHHSQRRHERMFEKRNSYMRKLVEFGDKAKYWRNKAENIMIYKTVVKGDAERKRAKEREELDSVLNIGSRVYHYSFGAGTITRIFSKSYRIKFDRGFENSSPKHFVRPE